MEDTLDKYIQTFRGLKVYAQGVVARDGDGQLRPLTPDEKRGLGIQPDKDFSSLIGQKLAIPGTDLTLTLMAK